MRTLLTLANIHYEMGLISYSEFSERNGVALWLSDELPEDVIDPRPDDEEESLGTEEVNIDTDGVEIAIASFENGTKKLDDGDEKWLELTCLNTWVFTKSDPDSYPSVPHGHYQSQNNKWPKLNPYSGRVFIGRNQEDKSKMLKKKELQRLWSSEKLKTFCREMITATKSNTHIMNFLCADHFVCLGTECLTSRLKG